MPTASGAEGAGPTRYGYTQGEWDRAVDAAVEILIGVARDHATIAYGRLCDLVHDVSGVQIVPGEFALPHFLGDVSRRTLASDGVTITALVTYQGSATAGSGLYRLAVAEGLLPKKPTQAQKDTFRHQQMEMAWSTWQRTRLKPGQRFRS